MDTFAGRALTHYQVLEKLGEGGMGVVYKARDTRLNRLVAIKVLPPDKTADSARRARFFQEAQTASALNHPNIVTIYEIDRDADCDFIVMELVPGRTLDAAIGRGLKLGDTLKFAIQTADALTAAHRAGIVHRDLKPSNVMVTDSGTVKVLDFGLAKLTEAAASADDETRTANAAAPPLTERGAIVGTVAYMSPEQAEGKTVDARSDIFSFGSLLYEMVTGQRAFHRDTKMSTLSAILRDDPKPLSAQAPRDLEKVIARCLRKDPARRFQHMDDIKIALEELKEESDSGRMSEMLPASPAPKLRMAFLYAGFAVILILASLLIWQFRKPTAASPGFTLRQLTQDSGLTYQPAISADGKLLAYASTRSGEGNLDIWVQQLTRGAQPIRLTRNKADDTWPSFSPDGGQIVFASGRDDGGIYVVPSLGGEERLVLRGTLSQPRFSPDGQWIAACTVGGHASKLLIVPTAGGSARRVAADFYRPGAAVWSPDGKKILFAGSRDQGGEVDWWVAPLDGGPIVKTGAAKVIKPDNPFSMAPLDWLDDYVLYSTGNLWRIAISPTTFRVADKPERLTTSSAQEWFARAVPKSGGKPGEWRIVLAATQRSAGLWSLPLDANAGKTLGEPVKLFRDTTLRMHPTLSADGSRLTYLFWQLDGWGVRFRDMKTGSETTLVRSPVPIKVRLSPDGAMGAYNPSVSNEKETVIYLVSSSGGDPRKFCDTCGLNYDWSPDGKKIIYRAGNPMRFFTIDVATGRQTVIVADPKHHVHGVRYSPDGRWIAMQYGPGVDAPRALFIMPARDGKAAPQTEWIPIMDRPGLHRRPWWSPDSNRLYFASTAEGPDGIWTQRLNPITKRPMGEPALVYRPEADRLQLGSMTFFGPGEGRDRLIFPLDETFGNIWMAE
jgi:serine/threonine protein kinase/Tol biopolymer transport system component